MKLQVYIDIDGTILYEPGGYGGLEELDHQFVCEGLEEFLSYAVTHCEPYWLTYRARLGKRHVLDDVILPHLPGIAQEVKVAYWDRNKVEGLNLTIPFVWFDDFLDEEDEKWLEGRRLRNSFVMVERHHPSNPVLMLEELKKRI